MLNLLPQDQKRKVIGEYTKRIWATISVGIILVVITSSTFLIPVYTMSHGTYAEALKTKVELEKKIDASQQDTSGQDIKDVTAIVAVLKEYSSTVTPSSLIESVISRKPAGISIKHISYTPSQDNPVTIDISGAATTRASLVSFSNNLQADKDFASVYIPISNFAHDRDIEFTVKLVAATKATSTNASTTPST